MKLVTWYLRPETCLGLNLDIIQKLDQCLVELFRSLQIRHMTGAFNDFQTRAANLAMHQFGISHRRDRIFTADQNQRRCNDARQERRHVPAEALLGELSARATAFALGLALFFAVLSRFAFTRALSRYTSASS